VSFLSKYEIGDQITDGEALTSKARVIASGREVLIHELPIGPDRTRGMDLLRMIHRNLRSLPPNAHNPILELGEHEGRMYLVTEAIPGFSSLRTWLESGLPTSPATSEAFDRSRTSAAPSPVSSTEATVVGPAPAVPSAARTQVIKVAPREWVLASAPTSPAPESGGTDPADITTLGLPPTGHSPAGSPEREAEPTATVRLPGLGTLEPSRGGSGDVTVVGLSPPVHPGARPSDVTMVLTVGSMPAPPVNTTVQPAAPASNLFEPTQVMPKPSPARADDASVVGLPPDRPAPSDATMLAPVDSITAPAVEAAVRPVAPVSGVFEATQVMPSASAEQAGGSVWGEGSGTPVVDTPRSWTTLETTGGGPSSPPLPVIGEFTMVLRGTPTAPAPERQTSLTAPSESAESPPPGEFTRLMQVPPAASPSPAPGASASTGSAPSGDFTRMFGGICAPSGPADRRLEAGSDAFAGQGNSDILTDLSQPAVASRPASVSSGLPEGLGSHPAGEFTKIFGASGATNPLSFGSSLNSGAYADKPQPSEFTQIFGHEGQAVPGREGLPGSFGPSPSVVTSETHSGGISPQPSAPSGTAPSGGAKAADLRAIKLPEISVPGKSATPPSPPAVPKIPPPPPAAAPKLPKVPSPAAAPKPAMPAAPKLPAPPKVPAPAAAALKLKAPPAAKALKPRKSYLPLVLLLGGLLVVATVMILYFVFVAH
jgi:hypothetical protein